MTTNWNDMARANAAQRWRKPSGLMGRGMTEAIATAAQIVPNLHVLDIACGTGEPAITIATALNGTGSVTATDISAQPMQIGEERGAERNLTNIRFQLADVHDLPFPDHSFDRVTSRLGVMFFSDLPKALSEIHRVLTPSGRVALLAWGPMQQPYFDSTIGVVRRLYPEFIIPDVAFKTFQFGEREKLANALHIAGFHDIDERQSTVPWNWPGTPEELWAYFQDVTVPFKPLLAAIPADARDFVTAEVLKSLHSRYDGEKVLFDAHICLATAIA